MSSSPRVSHLLAVPTTDTIVALSTPPGRSGIGVIRLSGALSLEIARALVQDEHFTPESHRVVLKNLLDPTGEVLDSALLTYFKAPHSYTGEDVVELSCHGSPLLLRDLIDVILSMDAKLAKPGEFTLRALSNGRLNLSQAEAIRDLIDAQTKAAMRQATRQLKGEISNYLQPLKNGLLEIIVHLESALEFVEDDLPQLAVQRLESDLTSLIRQVESLASTFSSGHLLRDGLKVTLVGRPNVGKSSLFNSLLVSDRAIVTDVPGTTRDSLSETISLRGVPVLLTDTAGVRSSEDRIEVMGVDRTRRAIADSDLVVFVLDASQRFTEEDREVFKEIADNLHIIALNKSDLACVNHPELGISGERSTAVINVSAKTGEGLDDLRSAILEPFNAYEVDDAGLLITNARHFDLLQRTQAALISSKELLIERASEELILVGLHDGLRFLGEITGETTPDDILSRIFATFCIGK